MEYGPASATKKLENQARNVLRKFNRSKLNQKQREVLANLDQNFVDARVYTNAWELSETPEEQKDNAKLACKALRAANRNILTASEFDAFDSVDVAQLSGQVDLIISRLK